MVRVELQALSATSVAHGLVGRLLDFCSPPPIFGIHREQNRFQKNCRMFWHEQKAARNPLFHPPETEKKRRKKRSKTRNGVFFCAAHFYGIKILSSTYDLNKTEFEPLILISLFFVHSFFVWTVLECSFTKFSEHNSDIIYEINEPCWLLLIFNQQFIIDWWRKLLSGVCQLNGNQPTK